MEIVCENCQSRFKIPDEKLAGWKDGRFSLSEM